MPRISTVGAANLGAFGFASGGVTAYNLNKSLRFRQSAAAYLNRTPASSSNRQKFTFSAWMKGYFGNSVTNGIFGSGNGNSGGTQNANFLFYQGTIQLGAGVYGVSTDCYMASSSVYRDPSAWYHVVLSVDTTQATDANRVKIYINNQQVTAFSSLTYPPQNYNFPFNNTVTHRIGNTTSGSSIGAEALDGYMAEINFIDGQQLTPASFGSTNAVTGVWQPAAYTGTYGTNGFYLPFTNTTSTTTLGNDSSGNGNNWTTNNFSLTAGSTYDSMTDVPTLTSATTANYCVLNPLDKNSSVSTADGNLQFTNSNSSWLGLRGTMGMSSGKWYVEYSITSSTYATFGIANASASLTGNAVTGAWGYGNDGAKSVNGTATGGWGATFTAGDIIGMAFDADAGTLAFYKNNVSQGNLVTGLAAGTYFPWIASYNSNTVANFGQRPLNYTAPTNYVALNTYNLPDSTIVAGNKYMDATIYTGNGTTTGNTQVITNTAGFKPDLVWIKSRSAATWNVLTDSVRGANKTIYSNDTYQEESLTNVMNSFNSNGFTAAYNSSYSSVITNANGATYVGWQWQAGQGTTSSNTNGSITSTVSVNASAGFSIVTYTGNFSAATVGHGLGVTPQFFIVKNRTTAGYNWAVFHASLGSPSSWLALDSTIATQTSTTVFNNTNPTSSVFSIGAASNTNRNGDNFVAYCWTPIAGFSKFGSYTGNGSTDGPFIYTGFRPKYILIKNTGSISGYGDWYVWDSVRNTYNIAGSTLRPNTADQEYTNNTAYAIDLVSNGVKIRNSYNDFNASGYTYIYAAFAENPFKNALAR